VQFVDVPLLLNHAEAFDTLPDPLMHDIKIKVWPKTEAINANQLVQH